MLCCLRGSRAQASRGPAHQPGEVSGELGDEIVQRRESGHLVDPVAPDFTSAAWAGQMRTALAAGRGTDTSEEQP